MYAAGQVPAYLITAPLAARCVLLTEPHGAGETADHRAERTSKFGETVPRTCSASSSTPRSPRR